MPAPGKGLDPFFFFDNMGMIKKKAKGHAERLLFSIYLFLIRCNYSIREILSRDVSG